MDFDKQKMVIQEIDELIELEKYDEAKKKLNNLYESFDEVVRLSKLRTYNFRVRS